MSSSRVVRGTKGRIILCVFVIIAITILIACFNNVLSQLDDTKRAHDQCHQQQENLSTQLQVIFDYKQRLEKSLKTEKAEHQQSKKDLENRLEDEQARHQKVNNEANLKFSSLQQHFNLLQAQHDDYKEECNKSQKQQLERVDSLQKQLEEVQGQLKQSIVEKDNSFEELKNQYMQLQVEKENLAKQIKGTQGSHMQSENEINHLRLLNQQLQRELEKVKQKCTAPRNSNEISKDFQRDLATKQSSIGNFSKQIDIGESLYLIPNGQHDGIDNPNNNVADLPLNVEEIDQHAQQINAPKTDDKQNNHENYNNNENENVLKPPNAPNAQLAESKSSSTKSTINKISKANLEGAVPLNEPTVPNKKLEISRAEERQIKYNERNVLPLPYAHGKMPAGVPPAPNTQLETGDSKGENHKVEADDKDIREEMHEAFPNRYRANLLLDEHANEMKAMEADKQAQSLHKDSKQNPAKLDEGDKENNAIEVFDGPLNNGDTFGMEDSLHKNVGKINIKKSQQKPNKHINGAEGLKLHEGQHKSYDAQDAADYDNNAQNDMQMEDEAEDDDPEYADPVARQKEPAVRN